MIAQVCPSLYFFFEEDVLHCTKSSQSQGMIRYSN